jgi:cytochrome c peroxidase
VLSGNSVHDRAEQAMRARVDAEETGKYEFQAKDYATVLKAAAKANDTAALAALKLDPTKDADKFDAVAASLVNGRTLFFGKARCNSCHVGDNFTDNQFHNLGVGVKPDGRIPPSGLGRFAAQPTGHKNPEHAGAFKTPTLRHLGGTAPYLHDGSEKTLEEVVDFYDRGGNANEYLDGKMRDYDAEVAYLRAQDEKKASNAQVRLFNNKPVVPLKLNLTPAEKKDLVLFLRALQGDPAHPLVADKDHFPK